MTRCKQEVLVNSHIDNVCVKFARVIYLLRGLKSALADIFLLSVHNAMFHCHLSYSIEEWDTLLDETICWSCGRRHFVFNFLQVGEIFFVTLFFLKLYMYTYSTHTSISLLSPDVRIFTPTTPVISSLCVFQRSDLCSCGSLSSGCVGNTS